MLATVASFSTLAKGSGEERNIMRGVLIDPLVDRLMCDSFRPVQLLNSTGNELGRPTSLELAGNVSPEPSGLESFVVNGNLTSLNSPLVGFVSQVVPGTNRWCVPF
jgi:hypothetical protein